MRGLFLHLIPAKTEAIGGHFFEYHYGLSSLFAILQLSGHSCFYKMVGPEDLGNLQAGQMESFDFIGVSATSFDVDTFNKLPLSKHVPILVGGVGPTLMPEKFSDRSEVTAVFVGETENTLPKALDAIATNLSFDGIEGVVIPGSDHISETNASLIPDLNVLPLPDRAPILRSINKKRLWTAEFIFSRGCPFQCSYCCSAALKKKYGSAYHRVRRRSVDLVIQEILDVDKKFGPVSINKFHDDNFVGDKKWTHEFCKAYKAEVSAPYHCMTRAELFDEDTARLLSDSGCFEIKMGLETGDEKLRREVLGRPQSDDMIRKAIHAAHKTGMRVQINNMIGIPGETEASLKRTIALNRELKPDMISLSMFTPVPGTVLYRLCVEQDLLNPNWNWSTGYFQKHTPLQKGTLPSEKLEHAFFAMPWQILFPSIAWAPSILAKIPAGSGRNVMELLLPLFSSLYRFRLGLWARKKRRLLKQNRQNFKTT